MESVLFSDVQGNIGALERMIGISTSLGIHNFFCLGDLVQDGDSFQDNRCIELVKSIGAEIVKGNHEERLLSNPDSPKKIWPDNLSYLATIPREIIRGPAWYIHHPFREDGSRIYSAQDIMDEFEQMTSRGVTLLFIGHSHKPLVVFLNPKKRKVQQIPFRMRAPIHLDPECSYIINPGTLGSNGVPSTYVTILSQNGQPDHICFNTFNGYGK